VALITQKELTKRLRDLERSGPVHRQVYGEVPPRVEYRLTELGLTLTPMLTALHEWAERYGSVVDEHWHGAEPGQPRPAEMECCRG
jgi:DNA-binding HxlR family transcriptional regulator